MSKRIWELDALRGVCIAAMVLVHLIYDLASLSYLVLPGWFRILQNWGGVVFFLISGISATRSRRSLRRGIIVFSCGMAITLCTAAMVLLTGSPRDIIIRFGVLHCLGLCMILWQLFRRLSSPALLFIALISVTTGFLLPRIPVQTELFFWLGLTPPGFSSPDYFPLLPFLGFFLLGSVSGRKLYPNGQSLLPAASGRTISFLVFCGRHSLIIYLVHQPLLLLIFWLISR